MTIGSGIFGAAIIIALSAIYIFSDIESESFAVLLFFAFIVFLMFGAD